MWKWISGLCLPVLVRTGWNTAAEHRALIIKQPDQSCRPCAHWWVTFTSGSVCVVGICTFRTKSTKAYANRASKLLFGYFQHTTAKLACVFLSKLAGITFNAISLAPFFFLQWMSVLWLLLFWLVGFTSTIPCRVYVNRGLRKGLSSSKNTLIIGLFIIAICTPCFTDVRIINSAWAAIFILQSSNAQVCS